MEHGIPLESIERGIGKSLLRLAIAKYEHGNQETIERRIQSLLSQGAKLHDTPKYAKSELMLAIERRFFRIANDFIALGADLNHVDGSENTALHIICERKSIFHILMVEEKAVVELCIDQCNVILFVFRKPPMDKGGQRYIFRKFH